MKLESVKQKALVVGRWFGRVLGAVAPFIPDPRAKLVAGAAAAALNAATDDDEKDDGDAIVERRDQV